MAIAITRASILTGLKRLAIAYLASTAFLYIFQRNILYLPQKELESPSHYGLQDVQQIILHTADGLSLCAWYHQGSAEKPVIVYFHGNGANIGNRANRLKTFANAGYGVLMPSYRGYACSEGKPTEKGLYMDGLAAIYYVKNNPETAHRPIILYGESLGTGVAIESATQISVDAVILESPYSSIASIAQEKFPWVPASLLVKDRFDSIDKMADIHVPVLIIHDHNDRVVPYQHGKAIYLAAQAPKYLVSLTGRGHLHIPAERIMKEVSKLAKRQHLIKRPHTKHAA